MLTCALEKAIFGEYGKSSTIGKNTIRLYEGKIRESVKAEVRPSGSAGTAPRRRAFGLVFRFIFVVFFVACAWLRRPSAKREGLWCSNAAPQCLKAALVYSNTRHSAIRFFTHDLYSLFASKSAVIILYTDAHTTILAGNSSTATTPYPSNIMTFALRQSFCF